MSDEARILQSRLDDFEAGLLSMQRVVADLPNTNQAERAIAVDRRLDGIARMVTAGVVLLLLVTGLLVVRTWRSAKDAATSRQGVLCLLEQIEEHRHAQRSAHQAFANKLNAPYSIEGGQLPPPVPREALEEACRPFIDIDAAQDGKVGQGPIYGEAHE